MIRKGFTGFIIGFSAPKGCSLQLHLYRPVAMPSDSSLPVGVMEVLGQIGVRQKLVLALELVVFVGRTADQEEGTNCGIYTDENDDRDEGWQVAGSTTAQQIEYFPW